MYLFFLYHSCSTAFYFPLLSTSSNPSLAYTPSLPSPPLPFPSLLPLSLSVQDIVCFFLSFFTIYHTLPPITICSLFIDSFAFFFFVVFIFFFFIFFFFFFFFLSFSSFFSSSPHSLPQCLLLSPLGSNAPNRQITLCSCSYPVQH